MNKLKFLAVAGLLAVSGVMYASSSISLSCGKEKCEKCTKKCSSKEKSATHCKAETKSNCQKK